MSQLKSIIVSLIATASLFSEDASACCGPEPAFGYDVPCNEAITYQAGPRVCNGWDFFVTASYLYWTSREDGLGYAATGGAPQNAVADVPAQGSVHHPEFDWRSGFQVGLGYNLPFDGWDIQAEYTWFHTGEGRDKVENPSNPNNQLVNIWGIGGSGIGNLTSLPPNQAINSASSNWKHTYNVIDLQIGRNSFIGRYFALRPNFGLRGTWQDQDYSTVYFLPPFGGPGALARWEMKQCMEMWGIGVRAGVESSWKFNRYFGLFVDGAVSVLASHFKVTRKDNQKVLSGAGAVISDLDLFNTVNDYYSLKAVIDFFIGLRGDWWTSNDRFHFRLDAGWQENLWISQNNFFRIEEGAHGDLVLHGLTLKARCDF